MQVGSQRRGSVGERKITAAAAAPPADSRDPPAAAAASALVCRLPRVRERTRDPVFPSASSLSLSITRREQTRQMRIPY